MSQKDLDVVPVSRISRRNGARKGDERTRLREFDPGLLGELPAGGLAGGFVGLTSASGKNGKAWKKARLSALSEPDFPVSMKNNGGCRSYGAAFHSHCRL